MKTTHTDGPSKGICPCNRWIIAKIQEIIGGPFDLDVAASPDNAVAPLYFTAEEGQEEYTLKRRWRGRTKVRRILCNPPWVSVRHRGVTIDYAAWIAKGYEEAKTRPGAIVACCAPFWNGKEWLYKYPAFGQLILCRGFHYGRSGFDGCVIIFRPDPDPLAGTVKYIQNPNRRELKAKKPRNGLDLRKVVDVMQTYPSLEDFRNHVDEAINEQHQLSRNLHKLRGSIRDLEEIKRQLLLLPNRKV